MSVSPAVSMRLGTSSRRGSLRRRVASAVALFAGCAALVASIAIAVSQWHNLRSSAPDRATSLAFEVAANGTSRIAGMRVAGSEFAMVIGVDESLTFAAGEVSDDVVDAALDSAVLDGVGEEFATVADEDVGSKRWSFAALACDETGGRCDAIVTGVATGSLRAYLLGKWHAVLLAVAVAATVAFLATRWLVGRSLRPIEAMRRELATITATNLEQRVTVTPSGDEVEDVGLTLNATLDRLHRAVMSNERFVADAAHELRSPLTGVKLALEIEGSKRSSPLLDDALVEVDRATRLVDDLLFMANGSASSSTLTDVDLDDLLRDELAALRIRRPLVRVSSELEPTRLQGDRDALTRLARNLLDNAAFYGDGEIHVWVRPTDRGGELRIDDDGPGIAPHDRDRVFDRFTRLDSSRARSTGGSGLGLAIAKDIVTSHRGTIAIGESSSGGASFRVTLPGPSENDRGVASGA